MLYFELAFDEGDGDFDGERRLEDRATAHADQSFLGGEELIGGRRVPAFGSGFAAELRGLEECDG